MTHHDKARELVEHLRQWDGCWPAPGLERDVEAAVDLITALTEENQRLRDAIKECEAEIDRYIWQEYPLDHPVHERYRQRDFIANPARAALSRTYTF